MIAMGITATGVTVRIRSTGADYGMHSECADHLISEIIAATDMSVLDSDFPAVITGPLFAPASEWDCARNDCPRA